MPQFFMHNKSILGGVPGHKFDLGLLNAYKLCTLIEIRVSNRTVSSREVQGRSRDEMGQDLETLKVPGPKSPRTKEVKKSRDFF